MKTRKRILGLFLSGMITACCLAGCGNSNGDSDTEAGKNQTEGREALTLTVFNNLAKEEFFDAFHEVYPEVELEVQSYAGANGSGYAMHSLLHGDIPDIYITSQNFSKEAQQEYLLDLSNYDFVNHYSSSLLDSMDVNGGIYLLPSGYQLTGIYYNKTILEENGWDVPTSLEELEALSKEIEAAGYKTMGNGMSLDGFPFNYFFNIGNTTYFGTPEGTEWKEEFPKGEARAEGNEGLKRTAEYFAKWVENGFVSSKHMDTEQFYNGESVFFLCLGLDKYEYTTGDGNTYEFGTMPWLSEDGSSNMLTRAVSRYMGINKALAEKGNEQKLEDALKLMDFISTAEGQRAMMSSSSQYMSSLNEESLPEDSPYQEIAELVQEGRTVPLVYVGWEKLIIPIAQDIKQLIEGNTDVDSLLMAFDETNDTLQSGTSDDIYARCKETLTLEDTARLAAGEAVDADCAMVSLNKYHGDDKSNTQGLGWYLYEGDVNQETVNLIRQKSATLSVLEMTGAEIKEMREAGFDLDGDGNPYEYHLFTKGDMELQDAAAYKLAVSTGKLTEDMKKNAMETDVSPAQAIEQYVRKLGTVSADGIRWE